jgi:hypothetical protein
MMRQTNPFSFDRLAHFDRSASFGFSNEDKLGMLCDINHNQVQDFLKGSNAKLNMGQTNHNFYRPGRVDPYKLNLKYIKNSISPSPARKNNLTNNYTYGLEIKHKKKHHQKKESRNEKNSQGKVSPNGGSITRP